MTLNWANLVNQGRAKALGVAWTPEEFEAVILLENEAKIPRTRAADFVRNGIKTIEDYNAAVAEDFTPKTLEEANDEAMASLASNGDKVKKKSTKKI
jgi:hypothetical protein